LEVSLLLRRFKTFKLFNRSAEPVLSRAEGFNPLPLSSPVSGEDEGGGLNVLNVKI